MGFRWSEVQILSPRPTRTRAYQGNLISLFICLGDIAAFVAAFLRGFSGFRLTAGDARAPVNGAGWACLQTWSPAPLWINLHRHAASEGVKIGPQMPVTGLLGVGTAPASVSGAMNRGGTSLGTRAHRFCEAGPADRLLVFTDVDGTLLDHHDYSWDPARRALERLRDRGYPVVLTTSKTLAELEVLQRELGIEGPVISENGALVALPPDLNTKMSLEAMGPWRVYRDSRSVYTPSLRKVQNQDSVSISVQN